MGGSSVITTIISPLFGMILGNIMWLSPFKAVQAAREKRDLGKLNPVPFVAIVANCFGWMAYSFFMKDHFLFWANIFGLVLGFYYSLNALTILAPKTPSEGFSDLYLLTERLFIFSIFFWSLMGLLAATLFNNFSNAREQCAMFVGLISCAFSIAYYGAPLSTMAEVVMKKDSSTLYFPTILVNIVNALCWFSYGAFGTSDPVLWVPNGLGLILCSTQIALIVMFKKQSLWDTLLGKIPEERGASFGTVNSASLKQSSKRKQGWSSQGSQASYEDVDEEDLLSAAQDTDNDRLTSMTVNPLSKSRR